MQDALSYNVFGRAYYVLDRIARLQTGESVLIHQATHGLGLAAVQIAKRIGATIFATAGSSEKRAHLQSLDIEYVMDSQTLDFADQILGFSRHFFFKQEQQVDI